MAPERGHCGIGIYGAKTRTNVGTLWRSAACMGADFIFTIGRRMRHQSSDTVKAWRHVPYFEVESFEEFVDCLMPKGSELIGVEQVDRAKSLPEFVHPERGVYLLGAEDSGLPAHVLEKCRRVVEIPSERCLNVATAGSIILYDREAKKP